MRWYDDSRERLRANKELEGTRRVTARFLWLPLTLHYTTRWLEHAKIEQMYTERYDSFDMHSWSTGKFYWEDIDWAD